MNNRHIIFLLLIFIVCSICSCKGKEDPVKAQDEAYVEKEEVETSYTDTTKTEEKENVSERIYRKDNCAWAGEYLGIVSDWHKAHSGEQSEGYSLIYLNDDNIPELCLSCDDYASTATDIYSYIGNEANHLDLFDFQHDCREYPYTVMGGQGHGISYNERKSILHIGYAGGGRSSEEGYIMNGAYLEQIYQVENEQFDSETGEPKDHFIVIYKNKDGSIEEDNGDELIDILYGDHNKYRDAIETEYGVDFDKSKGIGEDRFYSFDEITEELKHLSSDANTAEENSDYISLYLGKIDELNRSGLADQFALVNVNGDDIPELAACNSLGPCSDNTFLYTLYDNDAVLLESGIAGFDGYSIKFSEGKNIVITGSSMGGYNEAHFKKMDEGRLTEYFSFEEVGIFNPDEEIESYSINGKETSKTEYNKQFLEILSDHNPFTEIGYDALRTEEYRLENGYIQLEQIDSKPYLNYMGIKNRLNELRPDGHNNDLQKQPPVFPKSGLVISRSNGGSIDYSLYPSEVGEITLKNYKVNDGEWITKGEDIEFEDMTFKNLNEVINRLDQENLLPYTKDEMINFIVKICYADFASRELNCTIELDPSDEEFEQWIRDAEENGGEVNYVTVDEGFYGIPSYDKICSEHNDKARWSLGLYYNENDGVEILNIIGCKSFIMSDNQYGDITIDMGNYRIRENDGTPADKYLYTVIVSAPDGYVNFRKGAGLDYDIISEITNGEKLPVLSKDGKWLQVKYGGEVGWVAKSQVTIKQ